jgi:protein gp37
MTGIEWTEVTWNPVTGCDAISPGCGNCYARAMARRLKAAGNPRYQADGHPVTSGPGFAVTVHPEALDAPLRWRKPRMIFTGSMTDLFHARVPDAFIASVFGVMAVTPQHTYQVLTKRPRRMRALLASGTFRSQCDAAADAAIDTVNLPMPSLDPVPWPLPNVWAGTSIENSRYAWRAGVLRDVPAAVRFISAEPLLGPLDGLDLDGIGWVIAGGESGPGHHAPDLDWLRGLRDNCTARSVPFFYKQFGGPTPKAGGRLLDGRTWDEMPAITHYGPAANAAPGAGTAGGRQARAATLPHHMTGEDPYALPA